MDENGFEKALIELFQGLGYEYSLGSELERDLKEVCLWDELSESLRRINHGVAQEALDEAVRQLRSLGEAGKLSEVNARFTRYLQEGVAVNYYAQGENRSAQVKLVDYADVNRNRFQVVNQLLIDGGAERKRPDMVLFVNGLPLVVIELKSPKKGDADAECAYRQLRNYMQAVPTLFHYNAICVISDMVVNKAGTISAPLNRYMQWKSKDGRVENLHAVQFDTFYEGLFERERLLDILRNFILVQNTHPHSTKILAGYHQYFAVRKALDKAVQATQTDGKGGVFWHTQGSGKSLSMVFYVQLLRQVMEKPTIVVMTDRIDLDDQLYGTFARCEGFLNQGVEQATSKEHLKSLLNNRQANGIIFTTMFKFEEDEECLSDRKDIIVISDEAHRAQYGLGSKVVRQLNEQGEEEAVLKTGLARVVRKALPNATFVGFTGTPVALTGRNTKEVFGDYIDIYDMTQAVADGATKPVYYESRVVKINLKDDVLRKIDAYYSSVEGETSPEAIERSKQMMGTMEAVLGAPRTIEALCTDIIAHYEGNRAELLTGKAMIVAYSRPIAIEIYRTLLKMRPEWQDKLAAVMTGGNNDPEDWKDIIGDQYYKQTLANRFRDNADSLKIVIVVDMWLTGFDVPSLATMYVYKPMGGHNLMQAIARVNRVFEDKEGGLIVDYVGIAAALKAAMHEYTVRDRDNFGDPDIARTAYPKFQNLLQVCHEIFHGFGIERLHGASGLQLAKLLMDAVNFLMDRANEEKEERFMDQAQLLKKALSLCSSLAQEDEIAYAAYFESIRGMIAKIKSTSDGKKFSLSEMNDSVARMLREAMESEGVMSVFDSHKKGDFSLFDRKVLDEIAALKQKNVALELLKRLIDEQVSRYKTQNVVKAEEFSKKLKEVLNKYYNGHITNEEVVQELLKLAQSITDSKNESNTLGLNDEELAFYDALTRPAALRDFYENEQLLEMTRELTRVLRESRTVDWQHKESARADMRVKVRRLLRRYKYPPDEIPEALQTVILQCELWAEQATA